MKADADIDVDATTAAAAAGATKCPTIQMNATVVVARSKMDVLLMADASRHEQRASNGAKSAHLCQIGHYKSIFPYMLM
jgi:hypothetical protein